MPRECLRFFDKENRDFFATHLFNPSGENLLKLKFDAWHGLGESKLPPFEDAEGNKTAFWKWLGYTGQWKINVKGRDRPGTYQEWN